MFPTNPESGQWPTVPLSDTLSPYPLDSFPYVAGNWPVIPCQPVVHHSLKTRVQGESSYCGSSAVRQRARTIV